MHNTAIWNLNLPTNNAAEKGKEESEHQKSPDITGHFGSRCQQGFILARSH